MGKISIIQAGALTTIQDGGRWGHQHLGMPVGGAMDIRSLKLANYLVGNPLTEACLECTMTGPEIRFDVACLVAISGAEIPVFINEGLVNQNSPLPIKPGDTLTFGALQKGLRFYISISGKLDVPEVMGSKSTYLRAKTGGFKGRKLEAGDTISVETIQRERRMLKIPDELLPRFSNAAKLRILPGTEVQQFTPEGIKNFLTQEYTISPHSDRMGYRLSGEKIQHKNSADIISSGISLGAVQVPGDGQPIIMMADRQTIGGYTKIAQVIASDIPTLAQMRPGDTIRFKEVSLEEAQDLVRRENELWGLLTNR